MFKFDIKGFRLIFIIADVRSKAGAPRAPAAKVLLAWRHGKWGVYSWFTK